MSRLLAEAALFREWADSTFPTARYGEWECEYHDWHRLHDAVLDFAVAVPFASWSAEERSAVLYAVARDNETQYLSHGLGTRLPGVVLDLAEASLLEGEADVKWQLADELGRIPVDPCRREAVLLKFSHDDDEYVRRRCLQSLARTGSPAAENLAVDAWSRPDAAQQWSRMNALWVLSRIGSAHLSRLLDEACVGDQPHLLDFAERLRRKEIALE